jgi:antirestriction protein
MSIRLSFDETSSIIDSRDVIAKIADLEAEIEGLREEHMTAYQTAVSTKPDERTADQKKIVERYLVEQYPIGPEAYAEDMLDGEDSYEELKKLRALVEEGERFPDWKHGSTLVNEDHFEEYAKQFAEDIGAISNSDWPCCYIDWKAAANALKMDYSTIEYGGTIFYIRN